MSNFDQKNQKVGIQYNADKIIFNTPPVPNATELLEKGKTLLAIKSYSHAKKIFEQCLEITPDIPEVYCYLSISLVRGRRPKLLDLSTIRIIENHLKIAIQIQPNLGFAYVLWALIKYDFYVQNGMHDRSPSYQDLLQKNWSLSQHQVQEIIQYMELLRESDNPVFLWLQKQI